MHFIYYITRSIATNVESTYICLVARSGREPVTFSLKSKIYTCIRALLLDHILAMKKKYAYASRASCFLLMQFTKTRFTMHHIYQLYMTITLLTRVTIVHILMPKRHAKRLQLHNRQSLGRS